MDAISPTKICKHIFDENVQFFYKSSPKFVPKRSIDDNPALV